MITSSEEYAGRRDQLLARLPDESITILAASQLCYRNNDCAYPFRQNSNFYYLTGLAEPGHLLILVKAENRQAYTCIFSPEYNASRLQWEGSYLNDQTAAKQLGIDQGFTIKHAIMFLTAHCGQANKIYLADTSWKSVQTLLPEFAIKPDYADKLTDLTPELYALRRVKSAQEIALIQQAADISVMAHLAAMKKCHAGMMEYQLQAEFEYACTCAGAQVMAYNSIVAGGGNACVLHYQCNNQILRDGDLVLIDAGCEYQCYASDITRTYPVNGRFSSEQAAIYDLVLQAQQDALSVVSPGNSLQQVHQRALETLSQGLLDLGILSGSLSEVLEHKLYQPYFMHGIGHSLGLDVHDPGIKRGSDDPLEPGMVITVEPGIYISPDDHSVAPSWRAIGVPV